MTEKELLYKALKALKPFKDRVFNDNFDMIVCDTNMLRYEDFCNAFIIYRKIEKYLNDTDTTIT